MKIRRQKRQHQQDGFKTDLVWIGEGHDRLKRIARPITEADIPLGSLLSDETLAHIRAGDYGLQLPANYGQTPAKPESWSPGRWLRWLRRHPNDH